MELNYLGTSESLNDNDEVEDEAYTSYEEGKDDYKRRKKQLLITKALQEDNTLYLERAAAGKWGLITDEIRQKVWPKLAIRRMVIPSKYPPITTLYLIGVGFAFSGTLLLIIAFACPYWLESYPEAYTEFIRLGLWDVCFRNYRHPNYQIDKKIDGCHWLYSNEYQNIRDWLQPGWFIFVQFAMCFAMALSISTLFLISVLLMRYCVKFEMFILLSALVLEATAGVCIFLGITVFGGLCFDRSWLQYPNFNHLSWAYGLAVISFAIHIGAAGIFFAESTKARQRKRRANSIAYDLATKY